jgi:uncharacterized membrane protein
MKAGKIALGASCASLIFFATRFLAVPTPVGLFHTGDAVIFGTAAVLGPFAAIPAIVGSVLANILGFAQYIPATVVIKGLLGLLAGLCLKHEKRFFVLALYFILLECTLVIGGYFLYTMHLFSWETAIAYLPGDIAQAVFGIAGGLILVTQLRRLRI